MLGERKLDFFLAVHNRSRFLHHILQTGLALNVSGAHFVVFDDASNGVEEVDGLGLATVADVCRSFADPRVIYIRNAENIGFTRSLRRYYDDVCDSDYVGLLNPKDEFISSRAIASAISKLDSDPALSMVLYSLRQADSLHEDMPIIFHYDRMSGKDFAATYVRDTALQHCGSYAIVRASAARKVGIPRDMDLRRFGIDDGSGIDHDMLFSVATTGDVEFESEPPLRRLIQDGYTQRFPLSFAYSQYLYARRLMLELEPIHFVTPQTRQIYLSWWLLILARGLVASETGLGWEKGETRVRQHLRIPVGLFLLLESTRFRLLPSRELLNLMALIAKIRARRMAKRWAEALNHAWRLLLESIRRRLRGR